MEHLASWLARLSSQDLAVWLFACSTYGVRIIRRQGAFKFPLGVREVIFYALDANLCLLRSGPEVAAFPSLPALVFQTQYSREMAGAMICGGESGFCSEDWIAGGIRMKWVLILGSKLPNSCDRSRVVTFGGFLCFCFFLPVASISLSSIINTSAIAHKKHPHMSGSISGICQAFWWLPSLANHLLIH